MFDNLLKQGSVTYAGTGLHNHSEFNELFEL